LTTIIDHRHPPLLPRLTTGKLLRQIHSSSGSYPRAGERLLLPSGKKTEGRGQINKGLSITEKVLDASHSGPYRPKPIQTKTNTRQNSFLHPTFPLDVKTLCLIIHLSKSNDILSYVVPREADWEVVVTANRSISGRLKSVDFRL
jgi:hypothetical protein